MLVWREATAYHPGVKAEGEIEFVRWLTGQHQASAVVPVGIGDDMAVVEGVGDRVLLSSDMLLDGVHFDTARDDLRRVGRKAIACSLSDCAAMAVCPVAVTVSVALPKEWSISQARTLAEGMFELAAEYNVVVAGGDTTRWAHPLAIDVTVAGKCVDGSTPVLRSTATVGDGLFVTGPLGGSLLGRHLDFRPRVSEAMALAATLGDRLHAMMDISDGLSLDLWRLCEASRAGALLDELELDAVISDDARRAAAIDGRTAMAHALDDGEDFELLLAVAGDPGDVGLTLYPIGRLTNAGEGLRMRRRDGEFVLLEPRGYVH